MYRLRIWALKRAIKRFELYHQKAGTWEANPRLLMGMIFLVRKSDFKRYNKTLGKAVALTTGFKNAEHVIRALREVNSSLRNVQVLPVEAVGAFQRPVVQTLDAFLVDDDGVAVSLVEFRHLLTEELVNLHVLQARALSLQPSFSYYRRSVKGLCKDLFTIAEALLQVATTE